MANIDKAVADRLSAKLEKFDATLSDDERAAFKSMLQEGGLSDEALERVRGGSARARNACHVSRGNEWRITAMFLAP